jgi:hypothetical protein
MLETLVSSRIRRTLFEHILLHPDERFYLRGLAKSLQLPVSPLRRELKRLEQAGMLTQAPEGNILFYTVNTASPQFVQLKHASETTEAPSAVRPKAESRMPETEALVSAMQPKAEGPRPEADIAVPGLPPLSTGLQVLPAAAASESRRAASIWSSQMSHPVLLAAAGVGMALMVITVSLMYVGMSSHRLAAQTSRALSAKKTEVTVVMPQTSASGTMRGSRWQIVPGGFGGFSSGARNSESF